MFFSLNGHEKRNFKNIQLFYISLFRANDFSNIKSYFYEITHENNDVSKCGLGPLTTKNLIKFEILRPIIFHELLYSVTWNDDVI